MKTLEELKVIRDSMAGENAAEERLKLLSVST